MATSSMTQVTNQNGQTLTNGAGQLLVVNAQPAFLLQNNFSSLVNTGDIVTNGAPAAVSVTAEDVDVLNLSTGNIVANNGPDVLATGVDVTGSADIVNQGTIFGDFNGVSFTGTNSSGSLQNAAGATIASDSRAVQIQGVDVLIENAGLILGTDDQRDGTVYTNSTVENFTLINEEGGVIDAGEGNLGAGVALQVGDTPGDIVSNTLINEEGAVIQGRGDAPSGSTLAGDGVRFVAGAPGAVADIDLVNSGIISGAGDSGVVSGVRITNAVTSQGTITNTESGLIEGDRNGLFIGNNADGLQIENFGSVESDSRAVQLNGGTVDLLNDGDILGTGPTQRNGTVFVNNSTEQATIFNDEDGVIDAGEGNLGSGITVQLNADGSTGVDINNDGEISGRGDAGNNSGRAGDGIRLEGNRAGGNILEGTFTGSITNAGVIESDSETGQVSGVRSTNSVNFQGTLTNEIDGIIEGAQNGVFFGNGDNTGGLFVNDGVVQSDSRALDIRGTGLTVENNGEIIGTGDQRNGTVFVNRSADDFAFINNGLVDAGEGNDGTGFVLNAGSGGFVSGEFVNEGAIIGRGEGESLNTAGDGVRFTTTRTNSDIAVDIENEEGGVIAGSEDSDFAVGVRIDGGVNFVGTIRNDGEISGSVNAIDATEAGGGITLINEDDGVVNGNVLLSDGDDIVADIGQINGVVDGGAGDDIISTGSIDNVIVGGLGNDFISGGAGFDTADFSDLDVAVTVELDENGDGTATRDTGFTVIVEDVLIEGNPSLQPSDVNSPADFVSEALAGNLYFNVHTSDFPNGEIRGQLDNLVSDETVGNIRTIVLDGPLDGAQEPEPNPSDSEATGFGTITIVQDLSTGEVSYSTELSVVGLNEADLLTPAPGVVSAIHLHNAPFGINGGIVRDTLVDAGADLASAEEVAAGDASGVNGPDVIENAIETDTLISIERVIGSDDTDTLDLSNFSAEGVTQIDLDLVGPAPNAVAVEGDGDQDGAVIVGGEIVLEADNFENVIGTSGDDLILGNNEINVLEGGSGNDSIHSFGGADTIDGGDDIDTALFTAGPGVVLDLDEDGNGVAQVNAEGDPILLDQVLNFENINGSNNAGSPNGGADILSGNSGVNVLNGQVGDDSLDGEGGDDVLIGGLGNDTLNGGEGSDTADFSDLDVAVVVEIDANGNGTATRETGFSVSVADVAIEGNPSLQPTAVNDPDTFVSEALAGNLYFNIHTSDFPAGEIRGQLDNLVSDETVDNIRTIVLDGALDAAQEPDPVSDSEATGFGSITITVNELTGDVTYSTELSVVGLNEADLLTPAPGVASAIHLHNAPRGINGGIVRDTLVDAGATLASADEVAEGADTGVVGEDVIDEQVETDTLISIENIIGSDDADIITASGAAGNNIFGGDGDDIIAGGGGQDTLDGGEGNDTNVFNVGAEVIADLATGNASYQPNVAAGVTIFEEFQNFENLTGSGNSDQLVDFR